MNIEQIIENIRQQHEIVGIVDLKHWGDDYEKGQEWLIEQLQSLRRDEYSSNQRIVVIHTSDVYVGSNPTGLKLRNLQVKLNEVDITCSFVILVSTSPTIETESQQLNDINTDKLNTITVIKCSGEWSSSHDDNHPVSRRENYQYGSVNPINIKLSDLDDRKKFLLTESKRFCIYPWVHLHTYPSGATYPCCQAEMAVGGLGDSKTSSLEELWNSDRMKKLRLDMLNERKNSYCARCYEQEESGFFSGRQSANKHHGHHIKRIDHTQENGTYEDFQMTYWDIRFSNLCNLSCRSCGHIFSSSWYQDQAALTGPEWKASNKPLTFAGRTETDMWEQLIPHLDYVEQIYFAGGEPLMMEEHYLILEELERRERFDVRLIYNTNFTHVKLKNRYVFDYWKKFKSVAVGASLDAMGPRAEYIRRGTNWDTVERNRERMIQDCPEVDFYISPTLSIMNALHLPDFHRDWVDRGFIRAQDLNVNILQDPAYYRIDIAPEKFKQEIKQKFEKHLEWLRPQDRLNRATVGFESAINFMMSTDNTGLLPNFWSRTQRLDTIRNENVLEVLPELAALK